MKNKREITKKTYVLYITVIILVMLLAIALLTAAAILQSKGVNPVIYTVLGFSSFPILLFGAIFGIIKLASMQKYELRKKAEKLEKTELVCLNGASKSKIIEYCNQKKYKQTEGEYYHKRRFSLFNDYINYFIKLTDKNAPLDECVRKQTELFDRENHKEKNKCLIIVLFSEAITENELKELKEYSIPIAITELQIKMMGLKYESLVIALAENSSGKLFVLNEQKYGSTMSSSGVNLLRKILK